MHPTRTIARSGYALIALSLVLLVGASADLQAAERPPTPSAEQPLDINRASEEELTALPGIGPAMARRIVAFRDEHGPFRRVEDLLKVRGIGEKSFQKLRPAITVGDAG